MAFGWKQWVCRNANREGDYPGLDLWGKRFYRWLRQGSILTLALIAGIALWLVQGKGDNAAHIGWKYSDAIMNVMSRGVGENIAIFHIAPQDTYPGLAANLFHILRRKTLSLLHELIPLRDRNEGRIGRYFSRHKIEPNWDIGLKKLDIVPANCFDCLSPTGIGPNWSKKPSDGLIIFIESIVFNSEFQVGSQLSLSDGGLSLHLRELFICCPQLAIGDQRQYASEKSDKKGEFIARIFNPRKFSFDNICIAIFIALLVISFVVLFFHSRPSVGIPLYILAFVFWVAAMALASLNRRSENIIVEPIVISELKLRDVQRKIFAADLVEATNDTALEDAPETLNRICVNCADYMLPSAMIDRAVWIGMTEIFVDVISVSAEQTNFVGNRLAHKLFDFRLVYSHNDAGDNVALPFDRADNWRLEPVVTTASRSAALIPMAVFVFAADIGFINFDNSSKLGLRLNQGSADFVTHAPSCFVTAKAHEPHDLEGRHALFASEHQMRDLEPVPQRLVRVLEDGPSDMGEAVGGFRGALVTLPAKAAQVSDLYTAAARAMDAVGPSTGYQVDPAMVFIGESGLKLGAGHLVDWFRTLGHLAIPSTMEGI